MTTRLYKCEVKCSGAGLDIYLNEYHLYADSGLNHSYNTTILPWMELNNVLRIMLSAGSVSALQLTARVVVIEDNVESTLASFVFPSGIKRPEQVLLPFDSLGVELSDSSNLRFVPLNRTDLIEKPWYQTQDKIQGFSDVFSLYMEIQSAVVAKNIGRLMELADERISFVAQLVGSDRTAFEEKVRKNFNNAAASSGRWKTVKDPSQELTVHEYLTGKVVRVLDQKGNPPLRTRPDREGVQLGYDIVIAITPIGLRWIM